MADVLTASKQGNTDRLVHLLSAGNSANESDEDGRTALYWAACYGHRGICQYLLKSGVRTNVTSKWGSTPLHAACDRGHFTCVKMLIEGGFDINWPNFNGDTPLHLAAFRGHLEVVRYLLRSGADINITNDKYKTPLQEAESHGHYKVLRLFADHLTGLNSQFWPSVLQFQATRIPNDVVSSVNRFGEGYINLGCQSLVPNAPYAGNQSNMSDISRTSQDIRFQKKTKYDVSPSDDCGKHTKDFKSGRLGKEPTENEWESMTSSQNVSCVNKSITDKQTAVVAPLQNEAISKHNCSTHAQASHETMCRTISELESKVCVLQTKIAEERNKVELLKRSNMILNKQSQESNQLHVELQRNNETLQGYVSGIQHLENQIAKLQQEKDDAISYSKKLARELVLLHNDTEHRDAFLMGNMRIDRHSFENERVSNLPVSGIGHRAPTVRARGGDSPTQEKKGGNGVKSDPPRDGSSSTSQGTRTSPGGVSGVPRSDHELYLTVRPVFQSADQRFLEGLSGILRQRLCEIISLKRKNLEVAAGQEWMIGRDYVMMTEDPINHREQGNRDGSCSLIYRIAHKGHNYILKMMINLIDLIYRHHGDGQSLPMFLRHEFAAEYYIPSRLPPHRNVINILHHYDGSTSHFRRHLPLIIPTDLDVQVDMARRTTFMVMEEYPTTLENLMSKKKRVLPMPPFRVHEKFISLCLYQLLAAVSHLNHHFIVHRDIKGENIFLDSSLRLVLGDFGFARELRNQDNSAIVITRKEDVIAGNACAWAPELVRLSKEDPPSYPYLSAEQVYAKSDVFAVGMLFYSLLRHEKDQYFPQPCATLPHYMDCEIPDLPACYSEGFRSVIRHMVTDLPDDRLSANEALNRVGCLLFGPGRDEVFSQEDCQIWLQTQMMECVIRKSPLMEANDDLVLTVASASHRLAEELHVDFLSRSTCQDLWVAYSAMRTHMN